MSSKELYKPADRIIGHDKNVWYANYSSHFHLTQLAFSISPVHALSLGFKVMGIFLWDDLDQDH